MANLSPRKVIDAFYTTIDTSFQQGMLQSETAIVHAPLIKDVKSTTAKHLHHFKDFIPNLREVETNQPMLYRNIKTNDYEVKNREFDLGISISRNEFMDNQIGDYDDIAANMGREAILIKDRLAAELVNGAFDTTLTFDGQPWCGTHTVGLSTFTNVIEGALTADTLREAITILRNIKIKPDAESTAQPINRGKLNFMLAVHPSLEATAEQLIKAKTVTTGGDNINYNKAELMVDNWIEDANEDYWFLFVTSGFKPIYFQTREKPWLHTETPETSDVAYSHKEYRWGIITRCAACPTFPWLVVGGKPASAS